MSPLRKDKAVDVIAIAEEDDCMTDMFVLNRFAGRKLGVPLAQLEPIGADASTRESIADWRYWRQMGYVF